RAATGASRIEYFGGRVSFADRLARRINDSFTNSRQPSSMPRARLAKSPPRETSLYVPVKRFLEAEGFTVKGEICGCDLVALRGEEPPLVVIGELKLGFNLELVLQGINRTAACDEIW